jgi:signal transduction histidine kinase
MPVEIGALMDEIAEANRGPAAAKNQVIEVRADPDLWVRGDTERVREAVDNLVSNAVKYSPIGGVISVSAVEEGGEALIRSPIRVLVCSRKTRIACLGGSSAFRPSRPAAKAPRARPLDCQAHRRAS